MSEDWTWLDLAAMNHILMLTVWKCSRWEHKLWELAGTCWLENVRSGLVTSHHITSQLSQIIKVLDSVTTDWAADLHLGSANILICQHSQSQCQAGLVSPHNTPHLLNYFKILTRTFSTTGPALWQQPCICDSDGHPDLLVIYWWRSYWSCEWWSDQISNY